jgi:uncharacterized OsmC-like protein
MSRPLEYVVSARRLDDAGSLANVRSAEVRLDTSLAGRAEAFNPAELLLASLAGCMIKGAERAAPMLNFHLTGMTVTLHAVREDSPPALTRIDYRITVDTDEPERRLELLHTNIRKYGTISNTLAGALDLKGIIERRKPSADL